MTTKPPVPSVTPRLGDEPAREPIRQRPRAGTTRCPFCHDECQASPQACVCAECLSRHHTRCWDEGQGCSSCRATQRLEAPGGAQQEGSKADYNAVIEAWFKLGGIYNGGLVVLTLVVLRGQLFTMEGMGLAIPGAVLANLCFLLGPACEVVARRLGWRETTPLRLGLFLAGFLLALGMTLVACAGFLWDQI
jgi:hypothetical protein